MTKNKLLNTSGVKHLVSCFVKNPEINILKTPEKHSIAVGASYPIWAVTGSLLP